MSAKNEKEVIQQFIRDLKLGKFDKLALKSLFRNKVIDDGDT